MNNNHLQNYLFMYGESNLTTFPRVPYVDGPNDAVIISATRNAVQVKYSDGETEILSMHKIKTLYEVDFLPFENLRKGFYLNSIVLSEIMNVPLFGYVIPIIEIVKHVIRTSADYVLNDVFKKDRFDMYFENVHVEFIEDEDSSINDRITLTNEHFIITCYRLNYEIEIQILNGVDVTIKNDNMIEYMRLLILFGINIFEYNE